MPTYQYRCSNCNFELEVQQRIVEAPLTICPNCAANALARVIGLGGGFVLKGSGFYNTDYKNAPAPTAVEKSDTKTESKSESKSETKSDSGSKSESSPKTPSDSKSESKSETKSESKSETKSNSKSDSGSNSKPPSTKSE